MKGIKIIFFKDTSPTNDFDITDILISNKNYNSEEFNDHGGNDFINRVWDMMQIKVVHCHTAGTTAIPSLTIKWILQNLKHISTAYPASQVSKFIKTSRFNKLLIY